MAPPTQCLPRSVCGIISLETGLQILVGIAIILRLVIITTSKIINLRIIRLAGTICGCFYGPYIYLALPIGGIYLAGPDNQTLERRKFLKIVKTKDKLSAPIALVPPKYHQMV